MSTASHWVPCMKASTLDAVSESSRRSAAGSPATTDEVAYTERLARLEAPWKRWLDVQAPYRWNLRRLRLGRVLDVGCGLGRNLLHLRGEGVGIDTNPHSVEHARARGLRAHTPGDFEASPDAIEGGFDALLFAHVLEHLTRTAAVDLVARYLVFMRPRGRVVLITPQEAGQRSDPTHVTFLDFDGLGEVLDRNGLAQLQSYSFPFPRFMGRVFPHNEFVVVGGQLGTETR
jgi:SAM-dependent methyltransferase